MIIHLHSPKITIAGLAVVAALCTSTASRAQGWGADQMHQMATEVKLIAKDSTLTDCDWSALGADLAGKDLVLIGEQNHGTREIFELRNSLIAELRTKYGFDVVLFESGMGELLLPESASAADVANGLTGPWNTRSFEELMGYITAHHMAYAGFDVQRSGRSFDRLLRHECALLGLDTTLYSGLEDRYSAMTKRLGPKADHDTIKDEASKLIKDYDQLQTEFSHALPKRPGTRDVLIGRTLQNRADFLRYMLKFTADKDWNARWGARDSAMAGNIRWLADTVYPGRKLIVVAHNYHIARHNPNEHVMGEWLGAHYGDRMLVIGNLNGGGTYADNNHKPVPMSLPDSTGHDVKQLVAGLDGFAHYLRVPPEPTPGTQWMYGPVVVNDSFIDLASSNTMVPADHFDALLLIEHVSPPVFLYP